MKRLKHPDHGFADVSDLTLEKTMRSNGWVDDDGSELAAKLAAIAALNTEDAPEDEATTDVVRRTRGPNKPKG